MMTCRSLQLTRSDKREPGTPTMRVLCHTYLVTRVVLYVISSVFGVVPTVRGQETTVAAPYREVSAAPIPLVLNGVTVIDVQGGLRLPAQRVVIVGNRIQRVGSVQSTPIPAGARVVNTPGKYLIPGLWDMHIHPDYAIEGFYPLLLAAGVTGFRDAWSSVPLATQIRWRADVLAGRRVGPPRQLFAGPPVNDQASCRESGDVHPGDICLRDAAMARLVVDSLKTAGADFIKTYTLRRDLYFAVAAEARQRGIPFGGHISADIPAAMAADSGAWILDHFNSAGGLDTLCGDSTAMLDRCRAVTEHLQRHGTWWVPTLIAGGVMQHMVTAKYGPSASIPAWAKIKNPASQALMDRLFEMQTAFWRGTPIPSGWLNAISPAMASGRGYLSLARQVDLPLLAGTDVGTSGDDVYQDLYQLPGFSLQTELAMYVAQGLTPLGALQAATLNPARALHATDSLGTVSVGKLADLVLLDSDPLADITNLSTVRAVIANGRYYDRIALDQLLARVQAKAMQHQSAPPVATDSQPSARSLDQSARSGLATNTLASDVVTMVPMLHPDWANRTTYLLVDAQVDGRRGTFILDTGSPNTMVNGIYLRPNGARGLDTVAGSVHRLGHAQTVHMTFRELKVGTLAVRLDSIDRGPPTPVPTNGDAEGGGEEGLLGNLGLNAMEPFETILDFVHQRLVLIRLDAAGRRLAKVPAYTTLGAVSLVPARVGRGDESAHWWGIVVHHGGVADTLLIDSGTPGLDAFMTQVAERFRAALTANRPSGATAVNVLDHVALDDGHAEMLCYGFLAQLGVVGFNLRTHQLILYQ